MDPCFYRRSDALLILHADDMRCAGTPEALLSIHAALSERFRITAGDGTRFLGVDTKYDVASGKLTFGMETYIQSTMDRFKNFDTALGLPYRELVGCLLWVVLCVVGPELVRVKDLARRSNHPSPADYQTALKVLRRIYIRRHVVIRFEKGSAGKEWIPSSDVRPDLTSPDFNDVPAYAEDDFSLYPLLTEAQMNLAIPSIPLPTNPRFSQVAFTDASFAVGDLKMSVTGLVIYVNCTPIL